MRLDHRFDNITLDARNCSTVFYYAICVYLCVCMCICVYLCVFVCISVYFCDFYSDGIPAPMVTYTRQELFACNNAAVIGGKLPQPLFDAIKDNGICAVTRGCRAGRNCNLQ